MSVCFVLRERIKSGLEPPALLEDPERSVSSARQRPDPLDDLRAKEQAARQEDSKLKDIFKYKK